MTGQSTRPSRNQATRWQAGRLEAINRATGRDRSEIVREILHKWALEKIHEHSVLGDLLAREGLAGESQGR